MQNGEWWIDDDGYVTYADGDVGDTNHEAEAFWTILGVDREDSRVPDDLVPGEVISPATQKWLKKNGTSKEIIDYFKGGADAREYALDNLNWMRVKGRNIEVHTFDDDALQRIQGADDLWDEDDAEEESETAYVEEQSTRKTWTITFKLLLTGKSAEAVKRISEGSGQFRGMGGAGRWMRTPGGRR